MFLRKSYRVVTLDEAVESKSSEFAAITFDDGFLGVYLSAFPILVKYEIPATVFVISDYIGSNKMPWWEELLVRIRMFRAKPKRDQLRSVHRCGGKWRSLLQDKLPEENIVEAYKHEDDRMRNCLHSILADSSSEVPNDGPRLFISEKEIVEMTRKGISFGAHTRSHKLLSWLDERTAYEEIEDSKNKIQDLMGSAAIWFAYPDGLYSSRDEEIVRALGFRGAVQTYRYPSRTGQFAVPRIGITKTGVASRGNRFSKTKSMVTLSGFNKRQMVHAASMLLNRNRS